MTSGQRELLTSSESVRGDCAERWQSGGTLVRGWSPSRQPSLPAVANRPAAPTRGGRGYGLAERGRLLSDTPPGAMLAVPLSAARGLGVPRMVGFSQGAPFAPACAAHGVASAVAVVPGGDMTDPGLADVLDARVRPRRRGLLLWTRAEDVLRRPLR